LSTGGACQQAVLGQHLVTFCCNTSSRLSAMEVTAAMHTHCRTSYTKIKKLLSASNATAELAVRDDSAWLQPLHCNASHAMQNFTDHKYTTIAMQPVHSLLEMTMPGCRPCTAMSRMQCRT
jgi:hypothetical protein